jgi:outer membrane protein
MKKIFSQVIVSLVCILIVGIGYYFIYLKNNSKIGYIRSGVLIQEYKGMQNVSAKFDSEVKIVQSNLDTLKTRAERLNERLSNSTNSNEKKQLMMELKTISSDYENYNRKSEQQLEERKSQLGQVVLKEINDYIQKYGKDNGYNYILGTTNEGSVLYGKNEFDLTEIILNELNEKFSQKKSE